MGEHDGRKQPDCRTQTLVYYNLSKSVSDNNNNTWVCDSPKIQPGNGASASRPTATSILSMLLPYTCSNHSSPAHPTRPQQLGNRTSGSGAQQHAGPCSNQASAVANVLTHVHAGACQLPVLFSMEIAVLIEARLMLQPLCICLDHVCREALNNVGHS